MAPSADLVESHGRASRMTAARCLEANRPTITQRVDGVSLTSRLPVKPYLSNGFLSLSPFFSRVVDDDQSSVLSACFVCALKESLNCHGRSHEAT